MPYDDAAILPRTSGLLGRKDASIPAGVQSTSVISLHSRWNLHWFVRNLRIEPAELGADLSILLPGMDHLKLCQLWTTLPMLNALDPARQVAYMEKNRTSRFYIKDLWGSLLREPCAKPLALKEPHWLDPLGSSWGFEKKKTNQKE